MKTQKVGDQPSMAGWIPPYGTKQSMPKTTPKKMTPKKKTVPTKKTPKKKTMPQAPKMTPKNIARAANKMFG
jgi:hypothetical protein